jgi:CheY-like chemotaxis protein
MSFSILVVDEDPDVAEMFRLRFRREARQGYLRPAFRRLRRGGARSVVQRGPAGLIVILSDINMPGMDGLSLLREIKTRRPELPVMMVTAYGDDERRRHAAEAGAHQFLSKPVDFDQLKEELRRISATPI